jgi:succinate dehydrogenase / fumarate reductase membrane anchor subunit
MKLQSALGKARGLGSAKSGVHHWWMQRVTAIAMIGLSIWFVISLLTLPSLRQDDATRWLQEPHNTMLFLVMMLVMLYHSRLGLQVVIEDYIHNKAAKVTSLIALYFVNIAAMIIAAYSILSIGLG